MSRGLFDTARPRRVKAQPGTLYVVATPIGNLADLTSRARDILASVDIVAAEDTRHTGQLLTQLGIDARMVSLHEHNESAQVGRLLEALRSERLSVALVSDAGTPLISDPGYRLVAAARAAQLAVSPVPGCSAVIAALSVAGLPSDRFRFEGFLPAAATARRQRLEAMALHAETLVFHEAVHRIGESLADMAAAFGADRRVTVGREMTKRHETFYHGTFDEVRDALAADPGASRGEYTVVVAGHPGPVAPDEAELRRVMQILRSELPTGRAARLAARLTGARRRDAYRLAGGDGDPDDEAG